MFVVTLTFTADKDKAGPLMKDHGDWIERGVADDVFLLVGTLLPSVGGMILTHNTSRADLETRVKNDPLVEVGAVTPDIQELAPTKAAARLSFLLD